MFLQKLNQLTVILKLIYYFNNNFKVILSRQYMANRLFFVSNDLS